LISRIRKWRIKSQEIESKIKLVDSNKRRVKREVSQRENLVLKGDKSHWEEARV
jgi:hypothetical protein